MTETEISPKAEVAAKGAGDGGATEAAVVPALGASNGGVSVMKGSEGSTEAQSSTESHQASDSKPSATKRSAEPPDDDTQSPAKRRTFKVKGR